MILPLSSVYSSLPAFFSLLLRRPVRGVLDPRVSVSVYVAFALISEIFLNPYQQYISNDFHDVESILVPARDCRCFCLAITTIMILS